MEEQEAVLRGEGSEVKKSADIKVPRHKWKDQNRIKFQIVCEVCGCVSVTRDIARKDGRPGTRDQQIWLREEQYQLWLRAEACEVLENAPRCTGKGDK